MSKKIEMILVEDSDMMADCDTKIVDRDKFMHQVPNESLIRAVQSVRLRGGVTLLCEHSLGT